MKKSNRIVGPYRGRDHCQVTSHTCFFPTLRGDGNGVQRAAGAVYDFERGGDDKRAGRRQLVQVDQAGEPEFAGAVQRCMGREGRIETTCLPGICANRLYAKPDDVAFFR